MPRTKKRENEHPKISTKSEPDREREGMAIQGMEARTKQKIAKYLKENEGLKGENEAKRKEIERLETENKEQDDIADEVMRKQKEMEVEYDGFHRKYAEMMNNEEMERLQRMRESVDERLRPNRALNEKQFLMETELNKYRKFERTNNEFIAFQETVINLMESWFVRREEELEVVGDDGDDGEEEDEALTDKLKPFQSAKQQKLEKFEVLKETKKRLNEGYKQWIEVKEEESEEMEVRMESDHENDIEIMDQIIQRIKRNHKQRHSMSDTEMVDAMRTEHEPTRNNKAFSEQPFTANLSAFSLPKPMTLQLPELGDGASIAERSEKSSLSSLPRSLSSALFGDIGMNGVSMNGMTNFDINNDS